MDKRLKEKLIKGAERLGFFLSTYQIELFERFSEDLIFWNRIVGITANRTIPEIIDSMLLDSIAFNLLKIEVGSLKTCDFGTGGGFPGIPLKILYPDLDITLIDSSIKKCSFIERIGINFGLKNFCAVCERGGTASFKKRFKNSFDIVFSRACADMGKLIELTFPSLKQGGKLIAWKGPLWTSEVENSKKLMERYNATVDFHFDYKVSDNSSIKTIVVVKKGF